jgi:hypothetical protein
MRLYLRDYFVIFHVGEPTRETSKAHAFVECRGIHFANVGFIQTSLTILFEVK